MAVEGLEELSRVLLPASIRGPRPLEPPARSRLIGHRRPGRRARFPAEGVEGGVFLFPTYYFEFSPPQQHGMRSNGGAVCLELLTPSSQSSTREA
ncbi:uncharacterized protein BO87DRAFT_438362 [Aspergillus neoniger CBS 115656]|uniref:Uncharacterized protein n=1 Tax=Aspergillus neoniger (strain CBS 115656) TaxID=1448310 RepID=A0A318ZU45_ASPNB|nr:hypothetical protein BO87DRAFT_438362 [Aspergillus neoniger CBS 115656]PYH39242.1 hypothetical protein BO87DRAFT_438362 [Aspergillus neoniger CBS 115656]